VTSKELKAIRTSLGFTQEEFGKRLGVRKNTVWRWEHEERRVPETVARLVHYLAKEVRDEQTRERKRRP
jgi:transcriptional regulator with XRE-family HTH domain